MSKEDGLPARWQQGVLLSGTAIHHHTIQLQTMPMQLPFLIARHKQTATCMCSLQRLPHSAVTMRPSQGVKRKQPGCIAAWHKLKEVGTGQWGAPTSCTSGNKAWLNRRPGSRSGSQTLSPNPHHKQPSQHNHTTAPHTALLSEGPSQ